MAKRIRTDEEGNDITYRNEAVTDYWLEHYSKSGVCDLCGNHGVFDSAITGRKNWCFCPNGQKLRYMNRGMLP